MTENDAQVLAAQIALRNDDLKSRIDDLISRQEDVQSDILTLQGRKRQGETIDENQLAALKQGRDEVGRMIGTLAMERTELLDDIPAIRTASGKIKVIAEDLSGDATLIARATAKLEQVTQTLNKAESLLVKIIQLTSMI